MIPPLFQRSRVHPARNLPKLRPAEVLLRAQPILFGPRGPLLFPEGEFVHVTPAVDGTGQAQGHGERTGRSVEGVAPAFGRGCPRARLPRSRARNVISVLHMSCSLYMVRSRQMCAEGLRDGVGERDGGQECGRVGDFSKPGSKKERVQLGGLPQRPVGPVGSPSRQSRPASPVRSRIAVWRARRQFRPRLRGLASGGFPAVLGQLLHLPGWLLCVACDGTERVHPARSGAPPSKRGSRVRAQPKVSSRIRRGPPTTARRGGLSFGPEGRRGELVLQSE